MLRLVGRVLTHAMMVLLLAAGVAMLLAVTSVRPLKRHLVPGVAGQGY